ncbi:MAG TPA: hypothetical protein DDY81_06375 [Clostridiales bacterium]|nr:hypothetical protein [Clostridiales bacterium]
MQGCDRMNPFWRNFMKAPGGVRRTGLARWFQILEERFMTLFWANLLCLAWALPLLAALFFFLQTWDWLSGVGVVLGTAVLGPGVTALNRVCMQIIRDKPVSVAQEFFASVKRDWKQSALFALIIGALWGMFAWAVRLVGLTEGGFNPVLAVAFLLSAFVMMGLTIIGFQQIAMVALPFRGVLKNGFLLILAGGGRAAGAILFSLAAAAVCLRFYEYCVWYLILGAPALLVMTANLIFYPVFEQYFPEEDA